MARPLPKHCRCLLGIVSSAIVLLDQITKAVIVYSMPYGDRHPVIPGFFYIVHEVNTGAAWGMLSRRMALLALISLVVAVILVVYFRKLSEGFPERIAALILLEGGIVGNLIDRTDLLRHIRFFRLLQALGLPPIPDRPSGVVDFLQFLFGTYQYPAFNVADIAISVGVGLYIISSFWRRPEDAETKDKPTRPWPEALKEMLRP